MEAHNLGNTLRRANIPAFVYLGSPKLAKQLSFASKMEFPFSIIVGEDEIKSRIFKLKNMESALEENLNIDEIIQRLKL